MNSLKTKIILIVLINEAKEMDQVSVIIEKRAFLLVFELN